MAARVTNCSRASGSCGGSLQGCDVRRNRVSRRPLAAVSNPLSEQPGFDRLNPQEGPTRKLERYACSAAFSCTPSPVRESASTWPFSELRRKSRFGTPESTTALTVFGRSPCPPCSTTLVPAVT